MGSPGWGGCVTLWTTLDRRGPGHERKRAASRSDTAPATATDPDAAGSGEEPRLVDEDWAAGLLECLPWFQHDDSSRNRWVDINLQVRDTRIGRRVLFVDNGSVVSIAVTIPNDPVAAELLRSIISTQPPALWRVSTTRLDPGPGISETWPPESFRWTRPTPGQARTNLTLQTSREWRTQFPQAGTTCVTLRNSLRSVMNDGLEMSANHLRYSLWNSTGPVSDRLWGLAELLTPDRPTARGVSVRCHSWHDFTERLTWVLTTIPEHAAVMLRTARHATPSVIQIKRLRHTTSQAVLYGSRGPSTRIHLHMTDIGWWYAPHYTPGIEASTWIDPREHTGIAPSCREMAERTAATFRDVLGLTDPQQLVCEVFGGMDTNDLVYVLSELGLQSGSS